MRVGHFARGERLADRSLRRGRTVQKSRLNTNGTARGRAGFRRRSYPNARSSIEAEFFVEGLVQALAIAHGNREYTLVADNENCLASGISQNGTPLAIAQVVFNLLAQRRIDVVVQVVRQLH